MTADDIRALLDAANEPTGRQLRALSTPDVVTALAQIALAAADWTYHFNRPLESGDAKLFKALRDAGLA